MIGLGYKAGQGVVGGRGVIDSIGWACCFDLIVLMGVGYF